MSVAKRTKTIMYRLTTLPAWIAARSPHLKRYIARMVIATLCLAIGPTLLAYRSFAKDTAKTTLPQACLPAPALSDPNQIGDPFEYVDPNYWIVDKEFSHAPVLECGDSVLKNIGHPDASWRSKVFYSIPMTSGDSATVQFKLDTLNSKANFAVENGSDGSANRFGIEADLGRIYVKVFTGTFFFPSTLISPTKLNTWYELTLKVDDVQGFQIVLRDTETGSVATYTRAMPAGLQWRFSHYVIEGNSSLDNYLQTNGVATISAIGPRSLREDTSSGPIPFKIGNVISPATNLSLAVVSGDEQLLPSTGIALGGSGVERTLSIAPAANQFGSTVITLVLNTGSATVLRPISVTVEPVNDAPLISSIDYVQGSQPITGGVPLGPLPFTVGDIDNPVGNLTITATSSNLQILPLSNIFITGSGANRAITVISDPSYAGTVTVTVIVSDGVNTTSTSFTFRSGSRRFMPVLAGPAPTPTPPPCNVQPVDCFEPNNGFTSATPVTVPTTLSATLYGVTDERDYYTMQLYAGQTYVFDLAFAAGDLDLYVYTDGDRLNPVAQSNEFGTVNEYIAYTPTTTGKYYVLVFNYLNTPLVLRPYTLQLSVKLSQ